MPPRASTDLHGNAPDSSPVAMLIIDAINDLEFDGAAHRLVAHCLEAEVRGRPVVEQLVPDETDYFVLKPKHSGFYNTTLDLLDYLQTETVILTGVATDICVFFTAADAYMRDLRVIVPSDCVTALTPAAHRTALAQMRSVLKAKVVASTSLDLARLVRSRRA